MAGAIQKKIKQFQNANFQKIKKALIFMELYRACFCQCHFQKLLETVRKRCFHMGNQQETSSNIIQTILGWRGGKAIYFTDYFLFQSTVDVVTIHDGITSWAPLTSWRYADTRTTRWPLSCEVQNQHLNHYRVPSTFWIVVSMEIVILITSKFCFPPEFFYNSKWYKHKDGKNAVLFLKTHPMDFK